MRAFLLVAFLGGSSALLRGPSASRTPVPWQSDKKSLPDSGCFRSPWIDEMVRVSPDGKGKVFVDVGCNTGSEAVMWLERWGTTRGKAQKWIEGVKQKATYTGMCFPDEYKDATKSNTSTGNPKVLCVEPMPNNVKLLRELSADIFGPQSPMEVLQVVASDHKGSISFHDAPAGYTNMGVDGDVTTGGTATSEKNNYAKTGKAVAVDITTVDQLLAQNDVKTVDVLTVDTEGHDPDVLKGATTSLKKGKVRVLLFEVHQDLTKTAWGTTALHAVLHDLDAWQYDCYLTDRNGSLHHLNGVWNAQVEKKYYPLGWSNVVCARKNDPWHSVLEKYNVGLDLRA